MDEIVIDAENCIAGRTASMAAKALLRGKKVFIVNAEKALVSGNQKATIELFRQKVSRGDPYNGPFYPKVPDRILKRMVRGMLPRRKPLGREAFKGLRVYKGLPDEFKGRQTIKGFEKTVKIGMTLEKLSQRL